VKMASTDEQKAATVAQFREELEREDLIHDGDTIGTDDETLLRFLTARSFDLKQAVLMWRNCVEWRKTVGGVGIDELYKRIDRMDFPERDHILKYWPNSFHKTDKEGRPLCIQLYGGINMPELYKGVSQEQFWEYVVVTAEGLCRDHIPIAEKVSGKKGLGQHCIVDLKNFSMGKFWQMRDFTRDGFAMGQNYYPEVMSKLSIVNAPSSFTFIWGLVKPWLSPVTQSKVAILGADFRDVLLTEIDAEALPTFLGGTCTCEGLGGCMRSNAGPWMDGWAERRAALQERSTSETSSTADLLESKAPTVEVAPATMAAPVVA